MPAREQPPDLKKFMGKRLSVKLNGARRVVGRLSGFDVFMNLVLEEASEVRAAGDEVAMGILIVRGNRFVQLDCMEA